MLINLTNHPFEKWSQPQQDAASEQFGQVVDIAFPVIDPALGMVGALARQYCARVDAIFAEYCAAQHDDEDGKANGVHLMGETSFVVEFALYWCTAGEVREPLYVSTTEREKVENPDGTFTQSFRFVRFRAMGVD
jgi:hypothetical protein